MDPNGPWPSYDRPAWLARTWAFHAMSQFGGHLPQAGLSLDGRNFACLPQRDGTIEDRNFWMVINDSMVRDGLKKMRNTRNSL